MNDELPQGWVETTVGEIAEDISYGFTAKAANNAKGPRYLRITDIQNNTVDWNSVPSCNIPAKRMPAYQLCKGDLVFARTGATTGKSFLIKMCPEAVFASYLIRVRPSTGILPEFLANFFQSSSYWNQILENISGSAQPNCNATKLSSLVIPLPPLAEQSRLVTKLERLLSQVDACQARLAKIPALLKRFRQSVLAAACSGRLTEDWREENPTDETAKSVIEEAIRGKSRTVVKTPLRRELFNDDSVNDTRTVPQTWGRARVGELFQVHGGGTPDRGNAAFWNGNIPWLSSGDIKSAFVSASSETITKRGLEESAARLCRKGSVLIVVRSGILKHTLPVAVLGRDAAINQDIKAFDSGNDQLNAWLALALQASARALLAENREGTTVQSVKLETLENFDLLVPPRTEQQEITRQVEKLLALAAQIETRFAVAKKRVDSITQSILAKAFRGELVPTEYELAKAEGRSFESAQELLERIKANSKSE